MSKASSTELPKTVDPYRLAEQQIVLEGEIPLQALSRFGDSVFGFEDGAVCRVSLSFSMDGERRRMVTGELEAPVTLECQRCMGPMQKTLVSHFTLGLVTSDEQAQQMRDIFEAGGSRDDIRAVMTQEQQAQFDQMRKSHKGGGKLR